MNSNKKQPYIIRSVGATALLLSASVAQADISGKVFHDFNHNGTLDVTESGIAGVTVTATDATGNTANTTTAADGTYTFPNSGPTASGNKVRLEFSNLPNFANSGSAAAGTTTQFVTANATNVNFAVTYADNFCQANPKMATPLYRSGANNSEVLSFSYKNEGLEPLDKANIATPSVIGSLWGMAYSRSQKQLYAAAVLKRHTPLGSGGLDAIYTIDPTTGAPNATPWLQLTDDLSIAVSGVAANPQYQDNTARGVDTPPQNDASAFSDVMKVGIGDIELSADEKTLYAMNLYDKKVYAIDVANKTLKDSYAVPDASCSNGQSRPWALGKHQGKIYAGVTCDGSASGNPANLADDSGASNLKASVYRLDGATFTQVLTFPLEYLKEPPFQYDDKCKVMTKWKPWTDTLPDTCSDGNISYPSPVLSDIEFEDNGNMILGFTDRTGFQVGHKNYGPTGTTLYSLYVAGDILKACKTGSGWGIEGTVVGCASAGGLAINQADANGYPMSWGDQLAKAGEFYEGDYFHNDGNTDGTGLSYYPGHPEITIGGLAVVPNTGEVMSTAYDPVTGAANYGTGGVITLNNQSGKRARNGFELYRTTDADPTTASKGVGLGDLEMLCDPAPVEIGNRVWRDTDEDGIQDADETGIDGVNVVLTCGADTATTQTTNGGQYLFSSATNATFMSAGASCKIAIASTGQTPLDGLSVTTPNADGQTDNNPQTDLRDSDANSAGEIAFTVGGAGENNHTLDVGYKKAAAACAKPFDPMTGNHYLEASTAKPVVSSTLDDAAILGGERDMKLEKLQSDANYSSSFYVGDDGQGNGIIDFNNGPGDFSKATIVWDGNDNDANTLNPNGLGGVDLSSGDAFGMMVGFVDIERFKVTLRIYSGAANVSEAIFAYDNSKDGTSSNIPVTLTFAAVSGSGADLTKVGAVELVIEPIDLKPTASGIDLMIGKFTAPCPVVPAVLATDLTVEKTVAPTTAKRGETVVYTLTVTNESDVDATGVTVNDKLPAGVTYVAHTPTTASYDKASGDWNVGSVPAKTTAMLTINVIVD